jgi:hypothetical protein
LRRYACNDHIADTYHLLGKVPQSGLVGRSIVNGLRFVFRQFHVEGFVNQYVLDYLAPDGQTIAFVTEAIENIPTGWRAKETYTILNSDEFTEIFELAAPDKDFQTYSESHFKRATSIA